MRIVLDTNVFISALMGKKLSRLFDLIEKHKISIITSIEQIIEINDVINRSSIEKYILDKSKKTLLIRFLKRNAAIVKIKNKLDICRDKKDNFLIEIGIKGKADFLLTGDYDLLEIKQYKSLKIINFQRFNEMINGK